MPPAFGSLVGRALRLACALVLVAVPVAAQPPIATPPGTAQFMSRYDFHLSAASLAVDDDRFTWDTHFGGDFDFVDYVNGRLIFLADYQAVLGTEFRPFDPNQGNYTLGAAASVRVKGTELVGVLHHVSRHLGDRPKRLPIAWNEIDLRVLRAFSMRGSTVDLRVDIGKVIARANVDYDWNGGLDVTVRRPVGRRVGTFGRAVGQLVLVRDYVGYASRGHQKGGRIEGGVRFDGADGALELMAGVERVIDADPFDRLARHWFYAGFRLVTK
ncbi:MAG: hypothetical protein EXQ59_02860 [Acidobacteria bacterium]|nr:hypothetical protein [Acidobacteriota bacterium]